MGGKKIKIDDIIFHNNEEGHKINMVLGYAPTNDSSENDREQEFLEHGAHITDKKIKIS